MKPLDELTAHCIRCGFCLESCPTFLLTGEETESPRGRIYLVRSADEGKLDWEETRPHIMRCLGCRACETACPSGVEYGQIFEIARDKLESKPVRHTKKALLGTLTDPTKTRMQLALGHLVPGKRIPAILSRLLSGQGPEANKPTAQSANSLPPLDVSSLPAIRGEVYLLEGCVMRVLFPRVHEATRRLLRRVGFEVRDIEQGCCGSLHLHAGYMDEARLRGERLISALSSGKGDLSQRRREDAEAQRGEALACNIPVIVDSAGCGSTMKGYGELIAGAGTFSDRVFDASEFLLANGLTDALRSSARLDLVAAYHDACHLAHGQGIRTQPRELLKSIPGMNLADLQEADTCCGSAGIYNLTQPKLARELLERKWKNIEATGASIAAMGNPGCHAWIGQAAQEHGKRIQVLHTMELLEAAFIGLESFTT